MIQKFQQTEILGIRVDVVTLNDIINFSQATIRNNEKSIISYVNVHAVNLAYTNINFRQFLKDSSIVFCDGFGIKWALKLVKNVTLNRYTPPDWFDKLALASLIDGLSFYFIGSNQDVIFKAANILQKRVPGLNICGFHNGYFDKTQNGEENQRIIQEINTLKPDFLIVGFGMPMQENWICENFAALQTHVIIPVGAFFDYISGETKRAPRWMTDHGLEWLGRLIIEPGRLWKRYLIGNPLFLWRIFKHHVLKIPLPFKNCVE